jgi:hypothetical protein
MRPKTRAVELPPPSTPATVTINPPRPARRTVVFIVFLNIEILRFGAPRGTPVRRSLPLAGGELPIRGGAKHVPTVVTRRLNAGDTPLLLLTWFNRLDVARIPAGHRIIAWTRSPS